MKISFVLGTKCMGEKILICLDEENGEEAIQPQQPLPAVVVPKNAENRNLGSCETSPVMKEQRKTIVDSRASRALRSPAWMKEDQWITHMA